MVTRCRYRSGSAREPGGPQNLRRRPSANPQAGHPRGTSANSPCAPHMSRAVGDCEGSPAPAGVRNLDPRDPSSVRPPQRGGRTCGEVPRQWLGTIDVPHSLLRAILHRLPGDLRLGGGNPLRYRQPTGTRRHRSPAVRDEPQAHVVPLTFHRVNRDPPRRLHRSLSRVPFAPTPNPAITHPTPRTSCS